MSIADIIDTLEGAPRQGATDDRPEGARIVVFSDTLMNQITRDLRLTAAERPEAEYLAARQTEAPE